MSGAELHNPAVIAARLTADKAADTLWAAYREAGHDVALPDISKMRRLPAYDRWLAAKALLHQAEALAGVVSA
jgi:hypothetical protein